MAVASTDFVEAITHLPAGGVLRVDGVSWGEYEQLLANLGDGYAVRIFFDSGRMEIMAPASIHEKPKSVIHTLVTVLRDELDAEVESLGSATLRVEMRGKGAEPDDCFYIQNALAVIGKDELDLERDPPPDLVVEIDRTSASLDKFPIYAGLGVPELWRVVKGNVHIFLLEGEGFKVAQTSRAFPFVSADVLTRFLAQGLAEGERRVAKAFRTWVREHRPQD